MTIDTHSISDDYNELPNKTGSKAAEVPVSFIDWGNTRHHEPTKDEEKAARESTLKVGNATMVGEPSDDERTSHYDKLDQHNRDNYWKNRSDSNIAESVDYQFKHNILISFAYELSLSPLQRQLALDKLTSLDLPRFGHRTEVVAFCVCALVLNTDAKEYFGEKTTPYHPARSDENNDKEFVRVHSQLIERWGPVTKRRLQSVYAKLRQGSPPMHEKENTHRSALGGTEVQLQPSYQPEWTEV